MGRNCKKITSDPRAVHIIKDCIKDGVKDKQIQEMLLQQCGHLWTLGAIAKKRRALGGTRTSRNTSREELVDSAVLSTPPYNLTDSEKAAWFRDQFRRTHFYVTIRKQFEPEEVAIYLEEFGLLCCQFENIVVSEFMQIDDFIKHRILIDRQLIVTKSIQQQIVELQNWFISNNKQTDEDSKEAIKRRMSQQRLLDEKYKQLKDANSRYDSLITERQKIYSSLAATRKDRLEELRGGKSTFLELVTKLQHSLEERNKQGRLAELTKISSEDFKESARTLMEFPDGDISPVIFDEFTSFDIETSEEDNE